jgi:hypothetical protein
MSRRFWLLLQLNIIIVAALFDLAIWALVEAS